MAKTMIAPQTMTDGQINDAVEKLRAAMRKQSSTISKDDAQRVLGLNNLGMILFAPFRERAETEYSMIIRRVLVDRRRKPMAAIEATNRDLFHRDGSGESMPGGGDTCEEEDIYFLIPRESAYGERSAFDGRRLITGDNVAREFVLLGLEPDPFGQAAVNETDPDFATQRPNGTQWKNAAGEWCHTVFSRDTNGERLVHVGRLFGGWHQNVWFAGRRPVKIS